jgi:nucleotide-binding universal stress UspA family protein
MLVATDGSDLAAKAVEQGVLFAKEIGAKITAVTVTEPFHLLSLAPDQLEYTLIEYKKRAETPRRESAWHRFKCSEDRKRSK